MKNFQHLMFNPQPEPPGDISRFGFNPQPEPPAHWSPGGLTGGGPTPVGMLLPAVQSG